MSTLYKDIKTGMYVEFWLNISGKKKARKKGDDDLMPDARNHGFGTVLFAGPHFTIIQMEDGRKETIYRADIIDNRSQVQQAVKKSLPSVRLFR